MGRRRGGRAGRARRYHHRQPAQRGFVVVGPLGKREEKGQQLYTMYEAWREDKLDLKGGDEVYGGWLIL